MAHRRSISRATAGLSVALAASLAAAACSSSPSTDSGGTITILSTMVQGNTQGDALRQIVAEFEADNPSYHVTIEDSTGADIGNRYNATLLDKSEADLVILNITSANSNWLTDGLTVDTSQYLDSWGLRDKIQAASIADWTNADGVQGIPLLGFNWPFWYNTKLLQQAGVSSVPDTVDELIADAGKLRAAGIQPFTFGGNSWPALNWLTWAGQLYATPDKAKDVFTKGNWCDADIVKGLDLMAQLRDAGVYIDNVQGFTDAQGFTQYYDGAAAIMANGSWGYGQAFTDYPDLANSTKLAGFPVVPGSNYDKPTAFAGTGTGFLLSPNGDAHSAAVGKFLQYFYQADKLQEFVQATSEILAVNSDYLGEVATDNPLASQANALSSKVDYLVLSDNYLPAGAGDILTPAVTEFLGHHGETGAQICGALEAAYK